MGMRTLLDDEIRNEFEELGKMKLGSDEYKNTVDGLAKLMDRAIELDKNDKELKDKIVEREDNNSIKLMQIRNEKRANIAKSVIEVAGLAGGIALTVWGTYKTFEFEQSDTVTTMMGRSFIGRLMMKK